MTEKNQGNSRNCNLHNKSSNGWGERLILPVADPGEPVRKVKLEIPKFSCMIIEPWYL